MTRQKATLPRCPGAAPKRRANVSAYDTTFERYTLYGGIIMAVFFGLCCIFAAVMW